jgi:hypothetical protein
MRGSPENEDATRGAVAVLAYFAGIQSRTHCPFSQ